MKNTRISLVMPFLTAIIFISVLLLCSLKTIAQSPDTDSANSPRKPNIILISVDTLRPDHLGCYGYKRKTSPNLDKFASENLLFENCFSHAPKTGPSCSSFLSGFLPHETKVEENTSPLPQNVPMLSRILKRLGYKTYGVVSNYILRRQRGYSLGFDIYNDEMDRKELVRKMPERIAQNTTTCALDILADHTGGNFFLWIHYQDPHGSYIPPEPYKSLFLNHGKKPRPLKFDTTTWGKNGIPTYQRLGDHNDYHYYLAQYDGEIRYFDEHFARLIEGFKKLGFYDNSMIIFTADHGEALGENNYYFAHGHDLSHALIHVPLIIKYSDIGSGTRKDYVQHLDLVPTILKATGTKPNQPYRGRNLLSRHRKPAVICSELGYGTSIIIDGLKLLIYRNQPILFDLAKDPGEKRDLARNLAYKEPLTQLKTHLIRHRRQDLLNLKKTHKKPKISNEEREKLRSLGYVQ